MVEFLGEKKKRAAYVIGSRRNIRNDRPIIGTYGTNREGSGDMYSKGGNMLHTIRQLVNDDEKWRAILQGLNREFRHQTVSTEQIESYIGGQAGIDLSKVFDQYLRSTKIPLLQYRIDGNKLVFKYDRVVTGFAMPLRVAINGKDMSITPTDQSQTFTSSEEIRSIEVDRNFYVESERLQ